MRDYYKVLGLGADATEQEIKSAYRRLAFRYHPDRNRYNPIAAHMFKMICEAYTVLSDPERRSKYGATLKDLKALNNGKAVMYPVSPVDPVVEEMLRDSLKAKFGISPYLKRLLWVDILMSLVFLIYYWNVADSLPVISVRDHMYLGRYGYSGGSGNWMGRLMASSYLGIILSIAAAILFSIRGFFRCYKPYIISKSLVFVYLITGVFGLTTIEAHMLLPSSVALWNVFLIGAFAIGYLDRQVR